MSYIRQFSEKTFFNLLDMMHINDSLTDKDKKIVFELLNNKLLHSNEDAIFGSMDYQCDSYSGEDYVIVDTYTVPRVAGAVSYSSEFIVKNPCTLSVFVEGSAPYLSSNADTDIYLHLKADIQSWIQYYGPRVSRHEARSTGETINTEHIQLGPGTYRLEYVRSNDYGAPCTLVMTSVICGIYGKRNLEDLVV